MQVQTAWQALGQPPWRFVVSAWPSRALAFLLTGPLLIGAVALGLALFICGTPTAAVLVGAAITLLTCGPVVTYYERWRLRLVDCGAADLRKDRASVDLAYGVVTAMVLWAIDAAVIVAVLLVPGYLVALGIGGRKASPVSMAVAVAYAIPLLLLAAYAVTAWAGARAALARALFAPPDPYLGARLTEITRSRARLVEAFDTERKRLERDLHDGAQQQLISLAMTLDLARLEVSPDSSAASLIRKAHDQAKQTLVEIRNLTGGMHPQILAGRGLPAAVAEAATRCTVPVDVEFDLPRRPDRAVEVAAYYGICEALANIAKHSAATRATVHGHLTAGVLTVQISDDGVGGADPDAGTGLAGLADRLAAVDGRLLLSSPRDGLTRVRLEIPCR